MIRVLFLIVLAFSVSSYADDSSQSLEQLLERAQQHQSQEKQLYQKREQRFLAKRNQQKQLLEEAKAEFDALQAKNNPLQQQHDKNKALIEQLEKQLESHVQDMGDIFAIYTEFSGDFIAQMRQSLISSELGERNKKLKQFSDNDELPSIEKMREFMLLVQEEMTKAAQISEFTAQVTQASGEKSEETVYRIGTFSLISQGHLLQYLSDTHELVQQEKRPHGLASALKHYPGHLAVIDPSRGALLDVLKQSPSLKERIQQGGNVGYVILALGAIGLLIALYRLLYLLLAKLAIQKQEKQLQQLSNNNALGRVLLQAKDFSGDNDALQNHLNDAVLKELPKLEAGQSLLKLLAAVAPLLGLLGTVVGMIATFQSISLFGSGDPKLMAGGISQALVTTVEGLVVAIPLLFSHHLISRLSESLVQILDQQSAGFLAQRQLEDDASLNQ